MTMLQRLDFFRFSSHDIRNCHPTHRISVSPTMKINSAPSQPLRKELSIPQCDSLKQSNVQFDRQQHLDLECDPRKKFMVREAAIEEEYWMVAWLRAESHWEDRPNESYIDTYKRKFAEQEFNALKRRCNGQHIERCTCIVAVMKEEENVELTVLKSVVGTVDLSIQNFLHGETFPRENVKVPIFSSFSRTVPHIYGYIANLCVAKFARRQCIASNMLHFAIEHAKLNGVEEVFVHVNRDNTSARELYRKMGFQIIEKATPLLLEEQTYLLCFKT